MYSLSAIGRHSLETQPASDTESSLRLVVQVPKSDANLRSSYEFVGGKDVGGDTKRDRQVPEVK